MLSYNPCNGCGGEDCCCCEVYLERQADNRAEEERDREDTFWENMYRDEINWDDDEDTYDPSDHDEEWGYDSDDDYDNYDPTMFDYYDSE